MAGAPFVDLIPESWFAFIAKWTLVQSCRRNDYASLISIRARREFSGMSVDVASTKLAEISEVIASSIRASDLIGELPDAGLGILASDADETVACHLIQRIAETLTTVQLSMALTFTIGVGVYPTHGADFAALLAHSELHPLLNVRG